MKKKTIAISTLCGSAILTAFFLLYSPSPGVQEQKILQCLSNGNIQMAETILSKVPAKKLPLPLPFYKGLLAQARGKHGESHLYFQSALKNPKLNLVSDVGFAELANLYIENKRSDFVLMLDSLHREIEDHPLFSFFDGLSFYIQGEYQNALLSWETFDAASFAQAGKWGPALFHQLFPENFRKLYFAHALIETGEIKRGREILEKESRILQPNSNLHELATLFLGLSYLKESSHYPLADRGSFYQLSCFYLEKSSGFLHEKKCIAVHIQKEVEELLPENLTHEQSGWPLEFLAVLHKWKEAYPLEQLSIIAADRILREKDYYLYELLEDRFSKTSFYYGLTKNLVNSLTARLKGKEDLSETLEIAETLATKDKELAKDIVKTLREEIFETISQDDKGLMMTRQYVQFWEKHHSKSYDKKHFGQDLFQLAKLFWHTEGQEEKGLRLMEIIIDLDTELKNDIASFLTNLYFEAENSNMIRRLAFIYEALEYFGITRKEFATPCKIANYLADAEYLYLTKNFSSAKVHAGWVLKLDPQNEEALRLVGLAAFHLGEYNHAFCALNKLSNPDEYACKALILSQVYGSESSEKHLVQIDNSRAFDKDE